jgi:predicted RNA binding protein YcfA (HicA-like mRNA interferase family)
MAGNWIGYREVIIIIIKDDRTLSVPVHGNKDLGKGLLHALMKQGDLK